MAALNTMIMLTDSLLALDDTEGLVLFARSVAPTDQELQLVMDRQQTEIDKRRKFVRGVIADIARNN